MVSKIALACIALALSQACASDAPTSDPLSQSKGIPAVPATGLAATAGSGAPAPAGNLPSRAANAAGGAAVAVPSKNPAAAPTTGSATSSPPVIPSGSTAVTPPAQSAPPATMAMDECGLHTKWAGDEYCIKPPPADKGFQIHIGPANYENPEPNLILAPGSETVENYPATSGNTTEVYYYPRQYRLRPGTHHLILTSTGIGGHRIGGSQNLARDNPENGKIAPENAGIGIKLPANTPLNVNLHYMNFTDKPILKETWINIWYKDAKDVTEPATEMYSFAPINVPAGQHVLLHGTCPITGTGRILTHYGHRHANNQRFSTWRTRAGKKELVYEDYDWEEPLTLEYSSTVTNKPADPAAKVAGGWTGMLDLMPGDAIEFECDIVNKTTKPFRGLNEAENDEMCILIGDTVGTKVTNQCMYTTTPM